MIYILFYALSTWSIHINININANVSFIGTDVDVKNI